jgi:membrane protease YdiL (CAAX protease family)
MSLPPPASFRGKEADVPLSPALAALTFIALAVLLASLWSWLIAAAKAALTWGWLPPPLAAVVENALSSAGLSPRLPLVAWSPRRPVPWAFFDLLALIGIWLVVGEVLRRLDIVPSGKIETLSLAEQQTLVAANMGLSLLIALIGTALIALRTGALPSDFGWSWRDTFSDLRLGSIGFVMLAPPVYALQGVLVYFWQPSKHPLMEMFKGTPDAGFFALLVISAAVVAPLFEELIFRVLLQGFLEKAFSFRGEVHELFFGSIRGRSTNGENAREESQPLPQVLNPPPSQPELRGLAAWLPIAISSAIFALLHYSHGPDWIPLLLLAAGMGYLYQRTHRLLPSLVVHVSLNGLSMWGLWVQVSEGLRARS